ncbi:class I SAM-dependent methyltransferase [Flindersiella endophytica]
MNFAPDLYAGTADFYARYRVPYPDSLLDDLRSRAGLDSSGRLLDLACGPGKVALPLAPYVADVVAVDQEPDMIEVGRQLAESLGIGNVSWRVGRAEDLEFAAGSLKLVTIGNAFHRLDQQIVAGLVKEWLEPGGCLALLWSSGFGWGTEPWKRLVNEVVYKWTAPPSSRGAAVTSPDTLNPATHEEVLRAAGFAEVDTQEFLVRKVWTVDEIAGHTYSTSFGSKTAFGDRLAAFETELRETLLAYDGGGEYAEEMSFALMLAR